MHLKTKKSEIKFPSNQLDKLNPLSLGKFLLLISFTISIIGGCAEIGSPPGGEVDKSSPGIIASEPLNGSVNIPIGNRVYIRMSERILKPPKTIKSLFISPRQQKDPKIEWNSDHIVVTFADSFKTDQTYIITLGSSVKDLRNNPVDSSSVIAFSTGATIDSGVVSGTVKNNEKAAGGMTVGLFSEDKFVNGLLIDSTYPDYIVQTTRDGFFSFKYLPYKKFNLICFEDMNRDELVGIGLEPFAVPDRPIDLEQNHSSSGLSLFMATEDTASLKISNCGINSDHLVKVYLNKKADTAPVKKNGFYLISLEKVDTLHSTVFRESMQEKSELFDFAYDSLADGFYKALMIYDTDTLTLDSIRIELKEDKIKPAVESFEPDPDPVFLENFKPVMLFSEPIDRNRLTANTFTIWENDSLFYPFEVDTFEPFAIHFKNDKVETGKKYILKVSDFEIFDLAGNNLGDSLSQYVFEIIDPDSLGSVSGAVVIEKTGEEISPASLTFTKISNRQEFQLEDVNLKFNIALPAGKYLISGYLDGNKNRTHDKGSLMPYRSAETFQSFPDTVTVRSRFETTGLNLIFK